MFQINDNLDIPEPQKIIPLLLVTFVTKSTPALMMMIMLFMVMSIITMVVTLLLILVVFSQLLSCSWFALDLKWNEKKALYQKIINSWSRSSRQCWIWAKLIAVAVLVPLKALFQTSSLCQSQKKTRKVFITIVIIIAIIIIAIIISVSRISVSIVIIIGLFLANLNLMIREPRVYRPVLISVVIIINAIITIVIIASQSSVSSLSSLSVLSWPLWYLESDNQGSKSLRAFTLIISVISVIIIVIITIRILAIKNLMIRESRVCGSVLLSEAALHRLAGKRLHYKVSTN